MTAGERTQNWFEAYLAAPIIIVFFVGYKIIFKTKFKKLSDIDVTSGRRELDLKEVLAEERALQAKWPMWKKAYKTVC
jgi:amino acid transporter